MLTQFAPGQVWKYKTRANEPDSRITIVRVDADDPEYGNIVHIYVSDLDITNAAAPGGKTTFVNHMPYAEEILAESVVELESENQSLPEAYQDGYRLWREAFDKDEAGVFTVSVVEAIEFVQASIGASKLG